MAGTHVTLAAMTIVTPLRHPRRILAVCAATVALHVVSINWVSGRLGGADSRRAREPDVISVALRPAPPPPAPAQEAGPPEPPPPQPRPRPRKRTPAPPVAEALPAAAAGAAAAEAPVPPATAETHVSPEPGQAAAETDGQSGAAPAAADVESAQPAPPAQEESARWKVDLPPSARFELDVARKDADGTNWSGSASIAWQQDGVRYKATQEVGISLLIARINLMEVGSEGTVDAAGIAPATFTQKLRSRSATATHFNQQEQKITFSATDQVVPLQPGAQDRVSVLFQLAGIGRADVNQLGRDIDILVGEDRKAQVYRFQLVGEEELDTRMGRLLTWHLVRPPRPGSYNARLDIWLAPSLDWYPVQIRNTEASGAITTQTVTRITK